VFRENGKYCQYTRCLNKGQFSPSGPEKHCWFTTQPIGANSVPLPTPSAPFFPVARMMKTTSEGRGFAHSMNRIVMVKGSETTVSQAIGVFFPICVTVQSV